MLSSNSLSLLALVLVLPVLFRCQVKHPNVKDSDNSAKTCVKVEKNYSACHAGVMGVGNYKGRRHCGEEMEQLYLCVNPNASLP